MYRTEGSSRIGGMPTLWMSALAGILAVVPFGFLELINRRERNTAFPFVLFALLWVLPAVLFWLTISGIHLFRSFRARASGPLMLRVVVLGLLAWFWVAVLTDQMPCFLGVPNCD